MYFILFILFICLFRCMSVVYVFVSTRLLHLLLNFCKSRDVCQQLARHCQTIRFNLKSSQFLVCNYTINIRSFVRSFSLRSLKMGSFFFHFSFIASKISKIYPKHSLVFFLVDLNGMRIAFVEYTEKIIYVVTFVLE